MQQQPNIKFENISLNEGLSQSVVNCIIQDHIGFMWFGTQDGLNKYDGNKFTIFKNDPEDPSSIINNYIRCIFEDRKKNLWIGTNNGFSRYDREKEFFRNFNINSEGNKNNLTGSLIRTIYEDRSDNLWIGTFGSGLYKFCEEENVFINYCKDENVPGTLSDNRITALFEDCENNLFVGNWGGGVNQFLRDTDGFKRISLTDKSKETLDCNRINFIGIGRRGSMSICTNDGLFFRESKNDVITHFTHDPDIDSSISSDLVSLCFVDNSDNIWIGTREHGLNLFDDGKNIFYEYKNKKGNNTSLSNNSIMSVYQDRSGILWIGTFGGGLNKLNNRSKVIQHYYPSLDNSNSLSSSKVYALYEDEDEILWIGTRDTGLDKFDRKNKNFTNYKFDDSKLENEGANLITSIAEDGNGNLWLGTSGGGLNKFNKKTGEFRNYINDPDNTNSLSIDTIFSIVRDSSGVLWIGTISRGLNKFEPLKEKFTRYVNNENDPLSISSNRIRKIFIDSEETIWIGTDRGGLNKLKKDEDRFYHYENDPNDTSSLSENDVLSIFEDSNGTIWVGTMNGGLNKFDKRSETFKRYRLKDGLPNDSINGILSDGAGNLWISTNYGLSKFDPEKETFKNYDIRDGFQSNEFNPCVLKLKSGELAFGGVNGFNIFDPADIKDSDFIPPVVIYDFLIFNKPVAIAEKDSPLKKCILLEKEITLTYRESVFSFEFASLDYSIPGKNQYAYAMVGFDKDWVYSGNRGFATYTNLNPGEYLFKVKGSNSDGVWNEEGSQLKITITPPFWKTWWFKSLVVVTGFGTAGSIYKNKLNQVMKEKKAQEDFTKRLIDVQENDRKTIAEELHHSIGHDLLITKNKLLLSVKQPDDKEFLLTNINEVSEIITETLKDVREISYTLHPYQIERLGLSKAIQSIIDRVSKSTDINFITNIDIIDNMLTPDIEISLYRIIQECINNIIKHSKATDVILNINRGKQELSFLISDNGIGFNADKLKENSGKHGFGLAGITERTKLFGGKFITDSVPGKGTTFTIKLPVALVE